MIVRNDWQTVAFQTVFVTAAMLAGCTVDSARYFERHSIDHQRVVFVAGQPSAAQARELRMFVAAGPHMGAPIDWRDLLRAVDWADVVIAGEQHDDAIAHAVQRALVEDIAARWPNSALTLEMLERDEQRLIDDYAEGIIDAQNFARLTHSISWGSKDQTWYEWYQPIIDAALKRDSAFRRAGAMTVIGANAPRRYVRLARLQGYARLQRLPKERRSLFDLPKGPPPEGYWQRFQNVMDEAAEAAATQPETQPATQPQTHPDSTPGDSPKPQPAVAGHGGGEMTPERLINGFRSQRLWDSTMAASIARAKKSGNDKVIHLVGQFHSDFEGGLVHEIRLRLPRAKILIISMQREDSTALRDEDRDRADVVIYTGAPPKDESETETSEPEEDFLNEGAAPTIINDEDDDAITSPSHEAPAATDQPRSSVQANATS